MSLADRIETWPWSKTVILVGIITFIASQTVTAVLTIGVLAWPVFQPRPEQAWLVDRMVRVFETIQDGSLWAMGIGGGTLGLKRASTKADVIDAQVRAVQSGVGTSTIDGVHEVSSSSSVRAATSERGDE